MTPDDLELYGHDVVYIPVSIEACLDTGSWPWLAPDRNPVPHIDLFPRLAHTWRRLTRAGAA